jgi:hypothetical protein
MTVDTRVRVNPRDHAVLFYESTEELVTTVAQFVADGVWAAETSIIVATPAPHPRVRRCAGGGRIDVDVARATEAW